MTYPPQPWNLVADARVSIWRVPARDVPVLIQAESAGSLRLVERSGS